MALGADRERVLRLVVLDGLTEGAGDGTLQEQPVLHDQGLVEPQAAIDLRCPCSGVVISEDQQRRIARNNSDDEKAHHGDAEQDRYEVADP